MSAPQRPLSMVSRADVVDLCSRLGFDAKYVTAIEFRTHGIYVTFHALDADGQRIVDGDEVACHRLFVPIVDEKAP